MEATKEWAQAMFGDAQLGDARRTQRLVSFASTVADNAGVSISAAFHEDEAGKEGAYRFMRNDDVDPEAIAEAGFAATVVRAGSSEGDIVAAEDSTTLSYRHQSLKLGDTGGPANSKAGALWVHSVMLVSFETGVPFGLVEQERWTRDSAKRGQKHQRYERALQDKESYKWERASRAMSSRLDAALLARVVSVCDREADIYGYLAFKLAQGQRFVVRATQARTVLGTRQSVQRELESADPLGEVQLDVPQRGGPHARRKRRATLEVRGAKVTLKVPSQYRELYDDIVLWGVHIVEREPPPGKRPLQWTLLTSEPASCLDEAVRVMEMYRLRWRIEDFHKAWKTGGTDIEASRVQSRENLERVAVVTAFVAVRILQLRELKEANPKAPATDVLNTIEWKLLWQRIEKKKPPKKPPTVEWAYRAVARLGGWSDTKRTGRAGMETMWRGWDRLMAVVEGYKLAKELESFEM